MASRSPSRGRYRSRTRSPAARSERSRSPQRRHHHDSRSPARSTSPQRRNGRYRSRSRSRSRSNSRSRSRSRSWSRGARDRNDRDRSASPAAKSTKIVVERLSKNINEQHLYEIFGQFGRIKDLDLPMNRTFGTNRGTAYILYDYEDDAEAAIAHMHEAQVDGSAINVSIVLPRRKLSPAPPTARRGANIDPRVPFAGTRGGPPGAGMGGNNGMGGGGGGRRRASPGSRYGPRSDVYRPGSRSPSRSSAGPPPSRGGDHAQDLQVPGEKQPAATMITRQDDAGALIVAKVEVDLAVEDAVQNDSRALRYEGVRLTMFGNDAC
ncbi:RNA-binding protein with serine-rich domain 1-A [Fusarium oxysporum f. sp. cubense race 1]|uniref:RNA-binding protein with serine-rich domain 1-A n=1 Tax=Fusarium oxysporum f. sp. cubense (strain race 1) TaxID=1229664 RepID=N4TPS5_FUSC1|nr:RNA-binding protein with serine-rich domain 1-A [Fusarium oxysporum f. sp. cubense race 1]